MTATPWDTIIAAIERLTGCSIEHAYVDKGNRGHDNTNPCRVLITGQKHAVFSVIKRELRRRSAVEAVIKYTKTEGRLGRCHLNSRTDDATNAILSTVDTTSVSSSLC
jgi:transposase, IS5 family